MSDRPASPAGPGGVPAAAAPSGDQTTPAPGLAARAVRAAWSAARWLLASKLVRWGFVAAALGFGSYWVVLHWGEVSRALGRIGFLALAVALVSVVIGLLASMQVWRVLLAGLGSPLPARAAARVLFIGQLGKYLPGSVWPVLAQMELGAEHKVPRMRSASASVLTMLMSVLSGLIAALATLPFAARSVSYWWFLAAPVLLVCMYPTVLNYLLDRALRLARQSPLERPLTGRVVAEAMAWSLSTWVFYGLQIWLLATRVGLPDGSGAVLAIGAYAFAWCVGFLIVFVPAGTGIREVLLVAALRPVIGVGAAAAVALVSRVLMTAGDVITAAGSAGLGRRYRGRPRRAQQALPGAPATEPQRASRQEPQRASREASQ